MPDSPDILTGDEEIAQFLKVSVAHVRRHGDDIPVIRKFGSIRITSKKALQTWFQSGMGTENENAGEVKRARPVQDWHDEGAIADAGKRRGKFKGMS